MLTLFVGTDAGSRRIRDFLEDRELSSAVILRDVAEPGVSAELAAYGGQSPPALFDGVRLFTGPELIIARLAAEADLGRAT